MERNAEPLISPVKRTQGVPHGSDSDAEEDAEGVSGQEKGRTDKQEVTLSKYASHLSSKTT